MWSSLLYCNGARVQGGYQLKYYQYISPTKIDMLYKQTAGQSAMQEAILGFDLKIFKASIKSKKDGQLSDIQKLEAVIHQLKGLRLVGELDEGKPYIRGSFRLKFGGYGDRISETSPIAFWGGVNFNYPYKDLAFAMAGSRKNIIGESSDAPQAASSHSLTEAMVAWFLKNLPDSTAEESSQETSVMGMHRDLDDYDVANGTYLAASQMGGTTGNFEFIAKVLHRSSWDKGFRMSSFNRIVLATPLYVAMSEL